MFSVCLSFILLQLHLFLLWLKNDLLLWQIPLFLGEITTATFGVIFFSCLVRCSIIFDLVCLWKNLGFSLLWLFLVYYWNLFVLVCLSNFLENLSFSIPTPLSRHLGDSSFPNLRVFHSYFGPAGLVEDGSVAGHC